MTTGRPRTVSDEQILAGAARVIARMGPARLTPRFGSRRGLLLAVARHGADTLPRRLAEAGTSPTPTHALVEDIAGIAATVRTTEEFANHLAFLLLDLADPDFHQVSRDHANAVERAIAEVLTAGQAAGELISANLNRLPPAIHSAVLRWSRRSPHLDVSRSSAAIPGSGKCHIPVLWWSYPAR